MDYLIEFQVPVKQRHIKTFTVHCCEVILLFFFFRVKLKKKKTLFITPCYIWALEIRFLCPEKFTLGQWHRPLNLQTNTLPLDQWTQMKVKCQYSKVLLTDLSCLPVNCQKKKTNVNKQKMLLWCKSFINQHNGY